tara:strand:+ start:296 stop:547 length:252 start_codon:yes stop_codon:yes gene_type:complete
MFFGFFHFLFLFLQVLAGGIVWKIQMQRSAIYAKPGKQLERMDLLFVKIATLANMDSRTVLVNFARKGITRILKAKRFVKLVL